MEIDRIVSFVIALQETPGLSPIVSLRPRHTVFRLVNLVSQLGLRPLPDDAREFLWFNRRF